MVNVASTLGRAGVALAMLAYSSDSAYVDCTTGIQCTTLTPSDKPDLTFDCAWATSSVAPTKGFVYHMHGNDGQKSKAMFFDTMLELAGLGYDSLACDARGYSPNAAPYNYDSYHYDKLQTDISSIVDESGLSTPFDGKFHIVAHDQGARVVWHSIAVGSVAERLLSFASLSIPHADVFSDAIYGDNTNPDELQAAQYFRQLVLPNSTTGGPADNNEIWNSVCLPTDYDTRANCQKGLWWYNGAIDAGAVALPPMEWGSSWEDGGLADFVGIPYETVEEYTTYPTDGVPQTAKVGNVTDFPVLYACGGADKPDLCEETFNTQSAAYITDYSYLKVENCGHKVLECTQDSDTKQFIDAIIANIESAY